MHCSSPSSRSTQQSHFKFWKNGLTLKKYKKIKQNSSFFLWYRMFWPPMRTLPLGHPWIRGFIPYLVAVETVACFTRQSAMESSVVSSLPDHAFTPTPRKHGVERSTMKHSASCESYCWLFTISSPTFGRIGHWWNAALALDEPFWGMPTRMRVWELYSIDLPLSRGHRLAVHIEVPSGT